MPLKQRVAWFRQLKSIFPAPRRFLAPTRNRFRRPRPETDDGGGLGGGKTGPGLSGIERYSEAVRSTNASPIGPGRSRDVYRPQSSLSRVGPSGPGKDPARRNSAVSAPHYLHPLTRQILVAVSEARGTPGITEVPQNRVASEAVPESHAGVGSSTKRAAGYEAAVKAGRLPLSRLADYSSKAVGRGAAPSGRAMAPPAVPQNGDIAAFAADPVAPAEHGARVAEPSGQEAGRIAPSRATLHIDGHALGRWTVQHLEKVLGRPSAGMTGVDPRASTPRTRVSPF